MKKTTLRMLLDLLLQTVLQMRRAAAAGFDTDAKLHLAESPAGRIVLHLAGAWRDHRFQWHWQGIAREVVQH